jgi:predicted dehydrogenase
MTASPPPLQRGLVVGLGSIGRRHLANLRALRPGIDLRVLRRLDSAPDPGDPPATVLTSLAQALEWAPQFAVIASPAPFHVPAALALARAGAHLLVEKPLADTLPAARVLVDLCRDRGRVLMTGYHLRFSPGLRALRAALDEGRIGRVLGFRAEVGQFLPDWRPGRDYREGVSARADLGGGVVLELSHEFDYLRMLLGEVAEVVAWTGRQGDLGLDVEDSAEALVRFQGGAAGSVHLDMLQRAPVRQCRIHGGEGTLVWNGLDHTARLFRAGEGWSDLVSGPVDRNQPFLDELEHFLQCAAGGGTPAVTGEDGLRALEFALAVKQSAREGGPVRPPAR